MKNKKFLVMVSILLLILSISAVDARIINAAQETGTITGTIVRGYFEQPGQLQVTLTPEVKNWLSEYAGKDNCFATSGIWYSDLEGNWRIGSTGSVMSMFYVSHLLQKDDIHITWEYSYNDLKALNNNVDFTLYDVKWVLQNQYCSTK